MPHVISWRWAILLISALVVSVGTAVILLVCIIGSARSPTPSSSPPEPLRTPTFMQPPIEHQPEPPKPLVPLSSGRTHNHPITRGTAALT
jgi:hypothetical protein